MSAVRGPAVAAVAGALCISTSAIVMRLAGTASASTLALGRSGFALPVLALLAWLERRRAMRAAGGADRGDGCVPGSGLGPRLTAMPARGAWLARLAGVFLAGDLILWAHSIDDIGAGLGTVLSNLQVIMVPVLAWLVLGERPRRSLLIAGPVMVLGLVLVGGLLTGGGYGANPGVGAALGVGVGVLYSAYILLLRQAAGNARQGAGNARQGAGSGEQAAADTGGTAVTGQGEAGTGGTGQTGMRDRMASGAGSRPAVATLFEATLGATAASLVLGLVLRDFRLGPAWPTLGWLVVLALTSGVLGWLLLTVSLPRLPAWLGSALLLVQPAGSVLLGAAFLGERPSPAQIAGVILMLGGVLLAARGAGGATAARATATVGQRAAAGGKAGYRAR